MTRPPRRKQKPVRWLPKPEPPPLPPKRYCPRCEHEVAGSPVSYSVIYDCQTCEELLFADEVDDYPGQTKGKPRND